jgi:hypothetical protein
VVSIQRRAAVDPPDQDSLIVTSSSAETEESYPLSRLPPSAFALFAAAIALYLVHLVVAIANRRYLFGDNAWFLLKLLSERHTANWAANWPWDFYASRIGTFAVVELPTLIASMIAPQRFELLSIVFGTTAFIHKPLSLLICYAAVRDKRWVLFPAASLFAASMNSELYIVSETHLLHSLFWALFFVLLFSERLSGWRLPAVIAISIPTLLCYETMLLFGPVLALAALFPSPAPPRSGVSGVDRWLRRSLAVWYLLGAAFAAISIAVPRDPVNRNAFASWLLGFAAHPWIHPAAAASALVAAICAAVLIAGERRPGLTRWLVGSGIVASAALLAPILVRPSATDFTQQVGARSLHVPLPFAIAMLVFAASRGLSRIGARTFAALFLVVSALGIAQSTWHLLATAQWSNMLSVLRGELRTHTGAIRYESSLMSEATLSKQPIAALHGRWPLIPLSIVLSDDKVVRSMIVFNDGTFRPFDPERENDVPRLERYGFDYRPYFDALARSRSYRLGETIDFTKGGNGSRYRTGTWWDAESWATWTPGPLAGLRLQIEGWNGKDCELAAEVGGFVNSRNPSVSMDVVVNGCRVARWDFAASRHDDRIEPRTAVVPARCVAGRPVTDVDFRIRGGISPVDAGVSRDNRKLAAAFVSARLR